MATNKKRLCVIGCGTYGSYLISRLVTLADEYAYDIVVLEVGNEVTKNEQEIGFESVSPNSKASKDGRYFGFGGTSTRWGGQVLFYDNRDATDEVWGKIVEINQKYEHHVVKHLLGDVPKIKEPQNIKAGIWLKYQKRNIFKYIPKQKKHQLNIISCARVTRFVFEGSKLKTVCYQKEGEIEQDLEADVFYLTAGAIESCRLLLEVKEQYSFGSWSDLGKNFGDHLSVELFKVKNTKPILEKEDFVPYFYKGNLITKRLLVSAKNGRSGFAHVVINKDVQFFSALKKMLFGKQEVRLNFFELLRGLEFMLRLGLNVVFFKKLYAHRNNWSVQLDIEQAFPNANYIRLADETDRFGQRIPVIDWQKSPEDQAVILELKEYLAQYLHAQKIPFESVYHENSGVDKVEDAYHPVGFIRFGIDDKAVLNEYGKVKGTENLYHFSTAMFPSAKSINPTAAVFCFIEHHLQSIYTRFSNR